MYDSKIWEKHKKANVYKNFGAKVYKHWGKCVIPLGQRCNNFGAYVS